MLNHWRAVRSELCQLATNERIIAMQYKVIIDDDDRADAPDMPWTATLEESAESGVGSTPMSALEDLANSWRSNPALES